MFPDEEMLASLETAGALSSYIDISGGGSFSLTRACSGPQPLQVLEPWPKNATFVLVPKYQRMCGIVRDGGLIRSSCLAGAQAFPSLETIVYPFGHWKIHQILPSVYE